MRRLRATAHAWGAIAGAVWFGILCNSASAQRIGLGFLNQTADPDGARLEFSTPDGYSCRYTQPERPTVTVGGGIADPPVLNGIYGTEPIATRIGPASPVAGVFLRIPFGGKTPSDCDAIMKLSVAQIKLQQAIQLMELGLITDEQMKKVAEQTYAIISQP